MVTALNNTTPDAVPPAGSGTFAAHSRRRKRGVDGGSRNSTASPVVGIISLLPHAMHSTQ